MDSKLVKIDRSAAELATPDPLASPRKYAKASRSERTDTLYKAAGAAFVGWCQKNGHLPLPAASEVVATYISEMADEGYSPSSIGIALSAIAKAHREAKLPSPRDTEQVRQTYAGIRRTKGMAQRRVSPLLPAQLRAVAAVLPDSKLGARNHALLLVGFAGAFRRSELVALQVADVTFTEDGLEVNLRRSKTDQEGKGERKGIPYGSDRATCPVRALKAWLEAAGISSGPVFRSVTRHGGISAAALSDRTVAQIVKDSAAAAGLDASKFSGHSLRVGLATAAAKAGKSTHAIMRQTGHRSAQMVALYVREATLFSDNAASGIGL